tara:strand:- start:22212 stop:23276 length:1065 start_codon:yes stop_codon:yes gene_type:complete
MSNPSLRDVAAQAGVSAMTASRVVRGLAVVKPATAERVRQAITELGYRPDPLLSVLAGRRKRKGNSVVGASVAVVTPGSDDKVWRDKPGFRSTVYGAVETARSLGYGVEFALGGDTVKSWERVLGMLFARGVRGLLIPPVQIVVPAGIDWSSFTGVNVGFGVRRTGFDTVRHDNYQMTTLALEVLAQRGFQRIGVLLTQDEVRTQYRVGGATMASGTWGAVKGKVVQTLMLDQPLMQLTDDSRWQFLEWVRTSRPEVVVSLYAHRLRNWLTGAGIRVPQDVGLVGLNIEADRQNSRFAGVAIKPGQVGAAAAELLHSMILRGQTGRPDARQTLYLDGFWQDGPSIRHSGSADVC